MAPYKVRDIRIVFFLLSCILLFSSYRRYPSLISYSLFIIALILLFLLIFFPLSLVPVYDRWLKVSRIIAKFNTKVILLMFYCFIFIPTGLSRRFFGKDPMQRRLLKGTYWEPCELDGLKDKSRYEKQF